MAVQREDSLVVRPEAEVDHTSIEQQPAVNRLENAIAHCKIITSYFSSVSPSNKHVLQTARLCHS